MGRVLCVILMAGLVLLAAGDVNAQLPSVQQGDITVTLQTFTTGFNGTEHGVFQHFPTKMVPMSDGSGRRLIPTLGGLLRMVDQNGNRLDDPLGGAYLDVTQYPNFLAQSFSFGLSSVAPHPDFNVSGAPGEGKIYTVETEVARTPSLYDWGMPFGTGNNHATVLVEYTVDPSALSANRLFTSGGSQNVTRRELFALRQPDDSHEGGDMTFDENGLLYVSVGDGYFTSGGSVPIEAQNAADLTNPLGKILRIDPLGSNSPNGQYGIPTGAGGNFFANDGNSSTLGETYSYGERNPHRISYDPMRQELIVGNVGLNNIEEINIAVNGGNFGWPSKEGSFILNANTSVTVDADNNNNGIGDFAEANGLIEPVFEYDHADGRSVTGGFVYRGSAMPELYGKYVFADYQDSKFYYGNLDTGVFFEFQIDGGGVPYPGNIHTFGIDENNEIYAVNIGGTIVSLTATSAPSLTKGDFSSGGSGSVGLEDVPLFFEALVDRAAYDARGITNLLADAADADFLGDMDGDGVFDLGDIQLFEAAVNAPSSASSVPEPTAGTLWIVMLVALPLLHYRASRRSLPRCRGQRAMG